MAIALSTPRQRAKSGSRQRSVGRGFAWAYLVAFLFVTIFPFYWILRTALSNNYKLATDPSSPLPVGFTWGPFERALGISTPQEAAAQGGSGASINVLLFVRNSVIYAGVMTLCVVFFSSLAAYAFARLEWRGRNVVFNIFFSALLVPGVLTLLPNFVLIKDLHYTNTFTGLVLPGALFSAFAIFFLRQFMLGLSREIEEAALIDGAGSLKILFTLTYPMCRGPMTTLGILTFVNTWNDYFWPLLIANDPSVRPLTLALGVFQQSSPQSNPDWAGLMAATLVSALPMLLIFAFFGRRIVNSLGITGIK